MAVHEKSSAVDKVLNKLKGFVGEGSAKSKVRMTAEQAKAGLRGAAGKSVTAEDALSRLFATGESAFAKAGGQASKSLGRRALGLPFKAAGAPIGVAFLLYGILSKTREGQKLLNEARSATHPRTAESMLDELDDQRRRRMAVVQAEQNDPEMMESLKWALSGQQRPDLTPNQVMFGATPTNDQVPPELIRQALAAMSGSP